MRTSRAVSLIVSLAMMGWTMSASAAELSAVVQAPENFLNQKIELTSLVAENPAPTGHEYKAWNFVLGEAVGNQLAVSEEGFNPATIMKAHALVEKARKAGEKVTVTGQLKVTRDGPELSLESVTYEDSRVNTDEGPFVPTTYGDCYPGSPLFYDGYTYYPGDFPY